MLTDCGTDTHSDDKHINQPSSCWANALGPMRWTGLDRIHRLPTPLCLYESESVLLALLGSWLLSEYHGWNILLS
jgi:hypothetical protein